MKKFLTLATTAIVAGALLFAGCGQDKKEAAPAAAGNKVVLKVGASPVPHAEILQVVKPALEKEGIELKIVEFTDYVQPNTALADKELDANFFQHQPFLDKFNAEKKGNLVSAGKVHIEPIALYSKTLKAVADIPDGAKIAIPNDPSNGSRALLLLQKAGLLKLKDGGNAASTKADIIDNPKHIELVELEAAQLPRSLEDVSAAIINTNYALEAKLNPVKDSLIIEASDSPYVNILVVRKGDETNPNIQKLVKALQSPEVKKFINDKYNGAVVPAF